MDTVSFHGLDLATARGRVMTPRATSEGLVDADEAGELHVHSKPEQEIAYPEGTSSNELSFDKPGVFAVESHDLGITLIEFKVD